MKAVVSVIGKDQRGIISRVSTRLYEFAINVQDISQTIMQDYFTMIMLVDLSESNADFATISTSLSKLGEVKIKVALTSAVSVAATLPAEKSVTVAFRCVDVNSCAIDAELTEKVFESGRVSQVDITLKSQTITEVLLNVRKKNGDGTYSEILKNVTLPTVGDALSVDLGEGFELSSGETYEFTFIGCVEGLEVCRDVCYLVGDYGY